MRHIILGLSLFVFVSKSFALQIPSGTLAGGYSTDQDQPLPITCINAGPPTYSGSNIGKVDYAQSYDLSTVQQQLGIHTGFRVGIGLFSASDNFNFAKTNSEQSLAETLIYRSTYQFKDTNYTLPNSGPILNPVGDQFKNDPENFRKYCGDDYIAQLHNGAYLYIAFEMQFLTKDDQEKFNNHFSASFSNIFSLTNEISKEMQSQHIQGNIHLMAVQTGGDPTQLGHIINTGAVNCSLSNISACVGEMETILSYINGSMGDASFPAQLADGSKGALPPSNAAVVGYESYNYDAIAHIQSNSQLTPAIIAARDQLGEDMGSYMSLLNRANYIHQIAVDYNYVYDLYKEHLNRAINNIQKDIQLFQAAGQTCFNALHECVPVKQETYNEIQEVKPEDLALPTSMDLTETYMDGSKIPEVFVDTGIPAPEGEQYRGTIAIAGSKNSPEYDVYVHINGASIVMKKYDHDTQELLATYQGSNQGKDQYKGTVTYPGTQAGGIWVGNLINTKNTIMTFTKAYRGRVHHVKN